MTALLETRVEKDADVIEDQIDKISALSDSIREANEDLLMVITRLQEQIMTIRQNILEKQRTLSNLLRSELMPTELHPKLSMILRDVNSLMEHAKFSFERLDYLQETVMGLVNIEQNKIIKIFTIVSVIFMPPTLIASIFGQNFNDMPFTGTAGGFWVSIGIMVLFAVFILLFFKMKKWL